MPFSTSLARVASPPHYLTAVPESQNSGQKSVVSSVGFWPVVPVADPTAAARLVNIGTPVSNYWNKWSTETEYSTPRRCVETDAFVPNAGTEGGIVGSAGPRLRRAPSRKLSSVTANGNRRNRHIAAK